MLQKLLTHLQTRSGPISREALSAELGLPPETIDALLLLLLSKGWLEELRPAQAGETCPACDDCPLTANCGLSATFQERFYRLKSKYPA